MAQDINWDKGELAAPKAASTDWERGALTEAPAPARGVKGWGQDLAAVAVKGAVAVPEAAVGVADFFTGGRVGKLLENEEGLVGYRPKQTREFVNDWHSDATKEAQRKFQAADGIVDKAVTAVQNPSLVLNAVGESVPQMLSGGVAARGILAATRLGQMGAKGAALAGAAGEGLTMAGSQAEQIRQATDDGLLTPAQSAIAGATGLVGGVVGAVGGRVAQRLGIGDAETMLAQGRGGIAKQFADEASTAAVTPLVQQQAVKSIPRQVIEGAIAEGLLEELPQSVSEQIFQNIALDKPWYEEVDSAVVLGTLSGGAMGASAAGLHAASRPRGRPVNGPLIDEEPIPAEPPSPGLERVREAYTSQLQALQEQEQGEGMVPQSPPPDGAAALARQRAAADAQRHAEIAVSRAVESADDEIYQSTGADAMPRSARMGLDPAAGPLSAGAAIAVDSGASDQMQQAALLAQAAEAAEQGGKNQKEEQPALTAQGLDPETGEIPAPDSMANWSDEQLSSVFRNAQGKDVRRQLAEELQRRKAERHTVAETESATTLKGSPNGTQADQAKQAGAQPAPAGPAQAAPTTAAAAGAPAQGALSGAGPKTANPGAQAAAAPGAQAAAESTGQRTQRIERAGAAWLRMPTVERKALAGRLEGVKPILAKNLHGAAWDNLNFTIKRKMADLIEPAPALMPQAQAAIEKVARRRIDATDSVAVDAQQPSIAALSAAETTEPQALSAPENVAQTTVASAAQQAATSSANDMPEPTSAQKEAGNYRKGHARVNGLDISIENPAGSRRRPEWPPLKNHYGYIKGSVGADKDHVDVFMTNRAHEPDLPVFVVDQNNSDGSFDEHKVIMGTADEAEARSTYLGNYSKGWKGLGGITQMTQDEFKAWVRDPAKTKARAAKVIAASAQPAGAGRKSAPISSVGDQGAQPQRTDPAAFAATDESAEAGTRASRAKARKDARPGDVELDTLKPSYLSMDEVVSLAREHMHPNEWSRPFQLHRVLDIHSKDWKRVSEALTAVRNSEQSAADQVPVKDAESAPARPAAESTAGAAPAVNNEEAKAETVPQRMKRAKAEKAAAAGAAAKPKSVPAKVKEAQAARADYFTPGNIVKSYGGHDRVVAYSPPDENGRWSVTVRAVRKEGDAWVDVPREQDRVHWTQPDAKELKAGPVERSPVVLPQPVEDSGAAASKIIDFGEKIGGARKDVASKGPKVAKPRATDERPAWARRFEISQIAKSSRAGEEGRWIVRDARSLDAFKQPRRVGNETFATREEAEQALPLLAVAQKHRPLPLRGEGAGYEIWREVNDRKRVKVVEQVFPTREAAVEYMAQNAQAIIETNTTFGEADLPQPASEVRVGVQHRSGDARDSDFMDVFGFRGVEFGNWNNQVERQQLLNDAYDGLLDLAEVMGIPPRGISLDGDLALAFGARGKGLSGARAHYEPAKAVINLTKMNGAGSLAHEWFHALDHYFGRQDGRASAEWVVDQDGTRSLKVSGDPSDSMATGGMRGDRSGIRAEMRERITSLMRTISTKAQTYVEDTAQADRFVARARDDVQKRLQTIRASLAAQLDPKYHKRLNKPALAEQLAEFDGHAERIVAGELLEMGVSSSPSARSAFSGVRWTNDALDKISAILKAVRGRQGFAADQSGPLDYLRQDMQRYSSRLKLLAEAQSSDEKTRMVPTRFAMDAKELDQGRGRDYWTTPHELAARAFQGYVEDKLAAHGGSSPFLNYGPENVGIATPWGVKRPYPAGEERRAINGAFDSLVSELKTRETGEGNVALFRRGAEDDLGAAMAEDLLRIMGKKGAGFTAAARQQAIDSVRSTVAPITAAWENGPDVVVAYDMNDSVIPQSVRDADLRQRSGGAHGAPEGFYYRGKAYLMASRLVSQKDATRVLYHEVLGHHGLRGMFGPELNRILNQVATMRRAEVDAKMQEYGLRGVSGVDRRRAAEEVLAEMAEKNPQLPFVQRAVAAIRNFLRKYVPGFGSMRLSDNDIIQAYILPARGWVERGQMESRQPAAKARLQMPGVAEQVAGSPAYSIGGDADAMFSRARLDSLKASALEQLSHTFSHPGKVSVWDKSFGTMRNLAERVPAFKPVFESAQRFIDDVSNLGNDAADFAPRLLPRVDSLSEIVGKERKKPITAADNKAVARPLFEGTLMWARDVDGKPALVDDLSAKYQSLPADKKAQIMLRGGRIEPGVLKMWQGLPLTQYEAIVNSSFNSRVLKAGVVWSEKELQSQFGLNAEQVSLYQEARTAIDRSIDMTARADILRALGAEYAPMRDAVLAQDSLDDAVEVITRTLMDDARANPNMSERLTDLNNLVVTRQEKAQKLMDDGYAPLSRFGRYTVDVVDAAGERQYFGMYETMREANQMADRMREEFKGSTVSQGTMSAEAYKLFAGITPESLELFGNMLGLQSEGNDAQDKAFQAYLQLAKNNHSSLKRLIHRKGIAGYSEDVGRVLASFIYSNARQAAGGLNAGVMENAINAIPKDQGELKDVAMGLQSYIKDPQEEGQAVRGMLFAQYLGGSLASAFVNMTQPFAVTLPWLTQFGGMRQAGAQMARALKDMGTKGFKYEADLASALQSAEDDGVVSPQEIHQLMAQARGAGALRTGDGTKAGNLRAEAGNTWEKIKVGWGQPFALAEQFNRRSTFIAAYRIAKEEGMAEPSTFARKAVLETQFLYSKANKMRFARGAVGGTLMTFKTYSVSYLELMHRMWTQGGPEGKRAVGWAVAMVLLMSGAGGLPFMEDTEDLIDGAGQLMGYNLSAKQWRKQLMQDVVGKELAAFLEQGISGLPGAPVDVSGRLGMGNLIPGTGLFLSKQGRERDLLEVAGPAGDLVARGFTAGRKLLTGDVRGAALEVAPTAVRNAAKGIDMAASGIYKDTKGYKVIDTTLDEAIAKAIGFQPKPVAEVQEANSFMQRTKSFYTQTSSEIKAQWADALFNKDEEALERVRGRLSTWNRQNPGQPIVVSMPGIWKRVREMGKDRTQRIAETAPKALRQQMRDVAKEAG